jgi:hypothetical protein
MRRGRVSERTSVAALDLLTEAELRGCRARSRADRGDAAGDRRGTLKGTELRRSRPMTVVLDRRGVLWHRGTDSASALARCTVRASVRTGNRWQFGPHGALDTRNGGCQGEVERGEDRVTLG